MQKYRLGGWVSVRLEGRQVVWTEDAQAREKEAQLDGCYVMESDLPLAAASTQAVHDRYLDLTRVERDFRTLKTGLLEIRPVFLRKADRTRGQAVVSLLALKLARALERRVAPLGLRVDDAVERLKGVRLVCLGDADLGLWRLADSYPATQTEVLGVLPKLVAPVLCQQPHFSIQHPLRHPGLERGQCPHQHHPDADRRFPRRYQRRRRRRPHDRPQRQLFH